jgi:DNA-binding SARP family transcriptional activator
MRTRPISLVLLGGFRCCLPGGRPAQLKKRKARLLLAYLGCAPDKPVSREKLAALFWGDASDDHARQSLRQAIHALRQAWRGLPAEPLRVTGDTVTLQGSRVDVDVETFRRLAALNTTTALAGAAALYGGDLLDGMEADESPFDEWLATEREKLRALAVECLSKLLTHQLRNRQPRAAVATARRLLTIDASDERAHRALMRLFCDEGRYVAARRQYQACIDALARELDVRPSEETQALYRELLGNPRPRRVGHAEESDRRAGPRAIDPGDSMSLVGREGERAQLVDRLEQSAAGTGHAAFIQGEAGIGKSRLVEELIAEARRSKVRLLVGHAHESERILPFGPWVEAIDGAGLAADGSALADLPPSSIAVLSRLFPGLPGGSADEHAPGHYRRLFEALRVLLARTAAQRPLLVVLEDLQWADDMSLRLLAFLARRLGDLPVMIVGTAREEDLVATPNLRSVLEELDRLPRFRRLSLSPLSRSEICLLVRPFATAGPATAGLEEAAWSASEGNPFVAIETVRAIQDGTLHLETAGPRLANRVREAIHARLERLGPAATTAAETAAVIGRSFEFPLIAAVLSREHAEVAAAIDTLVRRRILRASGLYLEFSHDRIRDAIYTGLIPPRRAVLHAAIARALASLYATRLGPHFATLGMHAREAGLWRDAVWHFRNAAHEARRRFAFREAAEAVGEALTVLDYLEESPENLALAIDLRFEMRHALFALGELSASTVVLSEAETRARAIDDAGRLGWCHALTSIDHLMRGDLLSARPAWLAACAEASRSGDGRLTVATNLFGGMILCAAGEYRTAIEHLQRAAEILSVDSTRDFVGWAGSPIVMAHAYLAMCLGHLGEFEDGLAHGRQAVAIADERHQPASSVFARLALGGVHLVRGEIEAAASSLERAFDLADEWEVRALQPQVARDLGLCRALAGATAEGVRLVERALTEARSIRLHMPNLLNRLAQAYTVDGRLQQAAEVAPQALATARQHGQRGHEAWALLLLGEICARGGGPVTEARLRYGEAASLAQTLGMRPIVAHCHAGIGMLCQRSSRWAETDERFSTATAMYREMGMTYWLEKAKTEMRELR